MINCPNCGESISFDAKICPNCDHPLASNLQSNDSRDQILKTITLKICDVCGDENNLDAKICKYCGAPFKGTEKVIEHEKVETHQSEAVTKTLSATKIPKQKEKGAIQVQKSTKQQVTKPLIFFSTVLFVIILMFIFYEYNKIKIDSPTQNFNQESRIDLSKIDEINQLERDLEKDPKNSVILLKLANLNHDAGFFEKAISFYERFLQVNPNEFDAMVDMGVCYYELKKFDKAEEIFKSVIDKNPSHQIAYLNLGIVNLQLGKITEAKELFQKCIALGEHTEAGHRAQQLLKSH